MRLGVTGCTAWPLCVFSSFFFFQAEDGIRDATVTGVQTCALPINDTAYEMLPCWSSDVCSSDLMIRHTRCYRDWSSDVFSSDLCRIIRSEEHTSELQSR